MRNRASRVCALPPGLAPRGLSREEAAAYVGIGVTLFERLVGDGRMPAPKAIDGRRVWDRLQLDSAFAALPDVGGEKGQPETGDIWDRAAV